MTRHSRKSARLSVAELQARHRVEPAHTAHVTAIALRLFDLCGPLTGLCREHRRLLEAAAQLHDVAFARHPARHAEAGARILLREGIAGFSAAERAAIAGVVLLHSVRYREKLDDPLVRKAPERELVLRLAACLRVADGLDFEHLQNVSVEDVRRRGRGVTVVVRCRGRERSLVQADRKADLWREELGVDVRFQALEKGRGKDAAAVISAGDSVPEAARRLMSVQYKRMRDAADGFLRGDDAEALHDLRVALRRLRALLRIAGKAFGLRPASDFERELWDVSRALGKARDLEVWVKTWETAVEGSADRADCVRYSARLARASAREQAAARRLAGSRAYARLCSRVSALIRTGLEGGAGAGAEANLSRFAREQLARALRRMERRESVDLDCPSDDLHAYRKAVRRARYLAEFFEPALEPWGRKAARALNKMTTKLGLIHDIDIGTALLAREFPECPERCLRRLAACREKAVKQLKALRRRSRHRRWRRQATTKR